MKRTSLFLTWVLMIGTCQFIYGQTPINTLEVDAGQKILTLRNMRTSFGIGITGAIPRTGSFVFPRPLTNDHLVIRSKDSLDATYSLGTFIAADFMSPNSLIGLTVIVRYDIAEYVLGLTSDSTYKETLSTDALEIPILLKFRTGQRDSKVHGHIAIGLSYSMPIGTRLRYAELAEIQIESNPTIRIIGQFGIDYSFPKKVSSGIPSENRRDTYAQLFIRPVIGTGSLFDEIPISNESETPAQAVLNNSNGLIGFNDFRIEIGLSTFF